MRGYLIDVIEGKTHSVDVFDLEDYQKFIHCQTIDIVSRTIGDREYEIICDDEGLSKRPALVSAVNNDGQPMLVGNLIVIDGCFAPIQLKLPKRISITRAVEKARKIFNNTKYCRQPDWNN